MNYLQKKAIIPSDWNIYRMDEIYTERKEPGEEGLPVLSVSIHSGVSDGELDEEELGKKVKRIADKTQYRKAMAGDLVFNMMRAWQGAIGVVKTDGMVSPAYIVAKPNDKVWPLFMDYYMKTPRMIETIHRQSYGVTDFRLRLYWDSFAPIRCTLPSIEEQRRIAEILATQDRVIELYGRKIEEMQRFKKGALSKMFPKPRHNTPEVRFPGFTDAWEQRKLGELVQISSGEAPSKFCEGEFPYVKVDDLNYALRVVLQTQHRVQEHPTISKVKRQSIIFPKRGAAILTNKIRILGVDSYMDTNMMALTPQCMDSEFLYVLISREGLFRIADTSTIPQINNKHIEPYDVFVPKMEEQVKIGAFYNDLDHLITLHQRKRDEEIQKKKALMQLLITGKVRMSNE